MNIETETDEQATTKVRRVGQLLAVVLSEGVVEDTPIGAEVCTVLLNMGLVSAVTDELVDGASFHRLHFTPAGKLARHEDTVSAWGPTSESDVEFARAIDELQTKLNFELPAPDKVHPHEPWSRSQVISLVVARERLRPRAVPRAILVNDADGDVLERTAELLAVELEFHLPDREAAMRALRDKCVPWDRTGTTLLEAFEHVGLAVRSRDTDGRTDLIPLELTSVGEALVCAIGKGDPPW